MKFLSYNCKGFASPPKKLALRRLLTLTQLDIIFLQETFCSIDSLISTLNSWLPNWTFHSLDASRRSGGTTIGFCNKTLELRNFWGCKGFIGMDIFAHSLESEVRIMNVYGPCVDKAKFWRTLLDSELLQADNIILAGDLNFSLGYSESWGHSAQVDGLTDTISTLLEEHQWVDVPSARIQYTWTNNRSGDHSLARRLDRFLIKEAFLSSHPCVRQWVGTEGKKYLYTSLVTKRSQILKEREESWRLRSRALWLTEGHDNTKFFHKFSNGRKAINTIWELHNDQIQSVSTQWDLARLAIEHFKSIYKVPRAMNIMEIMRVAENFPRFVQQEDSENLKMEVTKEELEATIKWFKKDKSPGPDGWTIEFYIAFFDILGDDLLKIVEDCRRSGKISPAIKSTFIALIPKSDFPSSFNDFRPISLCNCLYKIIAKIIANHLKPILSRHISLE
eukprot:PITA_15141